eukprot:2824181-Amphidinium_carterae.1
MASRMFKSKQIFSLTSAVSVNARYQNNKKDANAAILQQRTNINEPQVMAPAPKILQDKEVGSLPSTK